MKQVNYLDFSLILFEQLWLLPLVPAMLHVWLNEVHNAGTNRATGLHNFFT
jgi:hypothetical protein